MTEDRNPEPSKGRAIVTYGRSLMSLVVAHSLGRRGVEVIGCDDVSMTVLSFSRYVRETFVHAVMQDDPDAFLEDMENAVRKHAPSDDAPYVLFPVFRETKLLANHRDRFEPTATLAAPPASSIDCVHPKDHLAVSAERWGLTVPQTFRPASWEELADRAATFAYPMLLKPADGVGGRGIVRVDDAEAVRAAVSAGVDEGGAPPMAQQFVDGEDYCVTVLARDGEVKAVAAYRNVYSFPRGTGAGAMRETVDHRPFLATVLQLMAQTRWNGVAEVDFRWSGEQRDAPYLIEVNPRFWAGLFHSVDSGVDYPWLLYQLVTAGDVEAVGEPAIGSLTKVDMVWLLAAVQDVAASDPHFEAAGAAWDEAKEHLSDGAALAAFREMASAASNALSATDVVARLGDIMGESRGAASELVNADDPFVSMGVLFVLGSLVRHGRLPPELKYQKPSAPAASETSNAPATPALARERHSGDRPIIGVTKPEEGDALAFTAMKVAVWAAGGHVVEVTAKAPRDPHTIDGLIFGGGSDIFPERYGAERKQSYRYDLARDELEASWADAARHHGLPVLGICRGAQMLNVLAGGTLYEDVRTSKDGVYPTGFLHRMFYRKAIAVEPDSLLAELIGRTEARVNSIHTQGIARLGDGLMAVAREENELVQAIEDRSHPFWLGVQFHPEFLVYRNDARAIFRGLVEAARRRMSDLEAPDASRVEAARAAAS